MVHIDHDGKDQEKETPALPIRVTDIGVWRVLTLDQSFFDFREDWKSLKSTLPLIRRLYVDIFKLGPFLFAFTILARIWGSIEPVLLLQLSSRLLSIIEVGLIDGHPDASAIINAVGARLICVAVAAVIQWWRDRMQPVFKTRVFLHFDEYLLQAKLRTDLPTSQDNSTNSYVNARDAWDSFTATISLFQTLFGAATQLAFIFHSAQSRGHGYTFALLCVAQPLLQTIFRRILWTKPHVIYPTNADYIRMKSLTALARPDYRQDVVSGNIIGYILKAYEQARMALGDTSIEYPYDQWDAHDTPWFHMMVELAGDLPMIYYAANAILNPTKFSLTSIAILQQSSALLRSTSTSIFWELSTARRELSNMERIYESNDVKNKVVDGDLDYPNLGDEKQLGMSFDIRNVTFAYPGTKSTVKALDDVSFSIKAGQLVVIVGANGSGKSTIVKILTRLYDVDEGQVLVDGHNIQKYKIAPLRNAVLTQDHQLYPLTIGENIGLGNPDGGVSDTDAVIESAKQGGSYDLISKFKEGLDTVLDPPRLSRGTHIGNDNAKALKAELEKVETRADVSGGERQRLVASRTFMRCKSAQIRFVAVDEPSSALDPEGEEALFKNLREVRAGKTMVFVTHRFGHLTKYADLILCMKDGRVAESGTHEELLTQDGEYAKLYNIQARAFTAEASEIQESP